jgi:hypothetical protein
MLAFDRAFDPPRMLDTALPGLECTLGMAAGDGHGPSLGRLQEVQRRARRLAGRFDTHTESNCKIIRAIICKVTDSSPVVAKSRCRRAMASLQ